MDVNLADFVAYLNGPDAPDDFSLTSNETSPLASFLSKQEGAPVMVTRRRASLRGQPREDLPGWAVTFHDDIDYNPGGRILKGDVLAELLPIPPGP